MTEFETLAVLEGIRQAIDRLADLYERDLEQRDDRTERLKQTFQVALNGALGEPPDLKSVT